MQHDQRVIDSVIRKIEEEYEADIGLLVQYGDKKQRERYIFPLLFYRYY